MVSISGELIAHVRLTLDLSLQFALTQKGVCHDNIAYTPHAFPAYVCAIAAIEAFANEQLLGPVTRIIFHDSSLWNIPSDVLEKLEIRTKVIIISRLLTGLSFSKGEQPFQDFNTLVKLRNDIVHYKMHDSVPSYVGHLEQRRIALPNPRTQLSVDYPWPSKISTTEGIRWANNTVCKIVNEIVNSIPEERRVTFTHLAANFTEIHESYISEWFARRQPH